MAGPFLDMDGVKALKNGCDAAYLPNIGSNVYVTNTDLSKPYLLLASWDTTGSWSDASLVLAVNRGWNGGGSGLLDVTMRTNNLASSDVSGTVAWSARNTSMTVGLFYLCYYADTSKAYADLYFKANGSYDSICTRVLTNYARGSTNNAGPWKVLSTKAGSPSAASSYLYASMNRRAYTKTVQSIDHMAGGSSAGSISDTYINGLF